jgi:hypothetical protein
LEPLYAALIRTICPSFPDHLIVLSRHSPNPSSYILVRPNVIISAQCAEAFNPYSFFTVKNKISYPNKAEASIFHRQRFPAVIMGWFANSTCKNRRNSRVIFYSTHVICKYVRWTHNTTWRTACWTP